MSRPASPPAPDPSVPSRLAAAAILRAAPGFSARVGLVLGSGLGALVQKVEAPVVLPYAGLPGFPRPGVEGHAGEMVLGRLGEVPVAVLSGRVHAYEGQGLGAMATPIRTLQRIGCDLVYLTSTAGGLRPDLGPGRLMTVTDHLNLMGGSPLVGPNDESLGPRFPSLAEAYHPMFRAVQKTAAQRLGLDLAEGVYAGCLGPAFETPAEARMIQGLGADAVGMSIVPECLIARHCGLAVTATVAITNLAAGRAAEPLSHAQTLRAAAAAAVDLERLILGFLGRLAATGTGAGAPSAGAI